jgi:hypothetical protein
MKKTIACSILLISLFLGCKKVDNSNENTPITPIKKDKISGLVQKGPYINGTQIVMYVLDDKLAQTGKVFNTQITDNKGSFELNNVELSSKYVELSANGYYFNESSNAITTSQLQLYALTDVTDASTINVNILTHLEKRRVEYLIKAGKTFNEAKTTAQKEILAIFGFTKDNMKPSESLDISASGDDNAILLAISLILQGGLSVGELSELLATISADIESDGVLSDQLKLNLRSSAIALNLDQINSYLLGRFQTIGVTSSIPDFSKFVDLFISNLAQKPEISVLNYIDKRDVSVSFPIVVSPNSALTNITLLYGLTTEYGNSVSSVQSPLISSQQVNDTIHLKNLLPGTTYHYLVKAENSKGIAYSDDNTFTTSPFYVSVGDSFQGGIVAYILNGNDPGYDENMQHGLIAADTDQIRLNPSIQGSGAPWYNGEYKITGATGTALGTGLANTDAIIKIQGTPFSYIDSSGNVVTKPYAAWVARKYLGGGYSDWYLPSKIELYLLQIDSSDFYWCSSESTDVLAWGRQWVGGGSSIEPNYGSPKSWKASVRAVRSF